MADQTIRVLVVDDSAFMRRALTRLIEEGRGMQVVGTASNGREALLRVAELKPDVVTMDVEMPEMDGVQALEAIMTRQPVPVVMLSSLTRRGADITMRCLELGAVDFIGKPSGSVSEDLSVIRYLIWQKVRNAANAHVQTLRTSAAPVVRAAAPAARKTGVTARRVVAIGSSTGGPRALQDVLEQLPATLPAGIVVVQHMPVHFTAAMAQRFNAHCALEVREAQEGDVPEDGLVLIAQGGRHLRLNSVGRVTFSDDPPIWGVRPSVDPMMQDVGRLFGAACLGVVLTGMGRDGADGMLAIKRAGGATIAQNEETCVVYGMPRAAVEAGAADRVLPLPEIAAAIIAWCRQPLPSGTSRGGNS